MALPVLKIAVVGHTNTGKTSLMRTLVRDTEFGEVSNRSATTRHVEGASLLVDGVSLVELYDTPGLEDSIRLLEHLDSLGSGRRVDWVERIARFLDSPAGHDPFAQETKVLRQVLGSDVTFYVIDARDRVLGKHRDELEILGRCAKPILPVLNFVASREARTAQWRRALARVNMHAVAEFDTVVVDEHGEQRLFEKLRTLLDPFYDTLTVLIEDRKRQRERLRRASAELLADLLIDVAAYAVAVPADDTSKSAAAVAVLKQLVREREQRCVEALLQLHRFRPEDRAAVALPIVDGHWGLDLFNPESLKQFGIRAGGGAAAGGIAGLAVDAMTGGITLGVGAAVGATLGALWSTARSHGRRLAERVRGATELRVDDATLRLLAVRQIELVQALLRRGHASQDPIRLNGEAEGKQVWMAGKLPNALLRAKANPGWTGLGQANPTLISSVANRLAAMDELADVVEAAFSE